MAAKIKSAVNWASNGPFDKEVNAIYNIYTHALAKIKNAINCKFILSPFFYYIAALYRY